MEGKDVRIVDLPEEILEHILSLLSPYHDFKSAMQVCKLWRRITIGVIQQEYNGFHTAIGDRCIDWLCKGPENGVSITERYFHSACYHNKSVYVFGGCTSTSTTFNDLWRFDLSTRQWVRPLTIGTYPSPKACASFVAYNDILVLFGGWSHPTPYPLHQAARFFNQLHVYFTETNRWSHVITRSLHNVSPPETAGHAATVMGDKMIVFGGSHGLGIRYPCNDVWILYLETMCWDKAEMTTPEPMPRYGHSQIVVDDAHIMIIGGCGGPNTQFTDVWVLSMDVEPWAWREMKILNPDDCPNQLWCHPACKVVDKVVILSKTSRAPPRPTSPPDSGQIGISNETTQTTRNKAEQMKEAQHPAQDNGHQHGEGQKPLKGQENGRRTNFKRRLPDTSESSSQDSSSDNDDIGAVGRVPPSANKPLDNEQQGTGPSEPHTSSVRAGMPSIRPNAMKNRQKQLETLKRYEDKIKGRLNRHNLVAGKSGAQSDDLNNVGCEGPQNPMYLHVLDISEAVSKGCVSWLPLSNDFVGPPPEERIFYTLVQGRAELILFGGIQADPNSMQRGLNINTHLVSNSVHFIKARKSVR